MVGVSVCCICFQIGCSFKLSVLPQRRQRRRQIRAMCQEASQARFPSITKAFHALSLSELSVRMVVRRVAMRQVQGTPSPASQAVYGRARSGSSAPPCKGGGIISERSLVIQKVEVTWLKSYRN